MKGIPVNITFCKGIFNNFDASFDEYVSLQDHIVQKLLELRSGEFCCFLGHLEEERVLTEGIAN